MEDNVLEIATGLKQDIDYMEGVMSDLKHINRGRDRELDYKHNRGKWFTKIRKLFRWTDIKIDTKKETIYVDPHDIGGTTVHIGHNTFKDEDVHLQWAESRSKILDTIIEEYGKVRDVAQQKYDNL